MNVFQPANSELRSRLCNLRKYGIPQWRIADVLGVSETQLSRALRHELRGAERDRLICAIADLEEIIETEEPLVTDEG